MKRHLMTQFSDQQQQQQQQQHKPTSPKRAHHNDFEYATLQPVPEEYLPLPPDPQSTVLYFGNIPPQSKISDVINCLRGGMIESIQYLPQKNIAFVSFLDQLGARLCFYHLTMQPIQLQHQEIRVGWGKPTREMKWQLRERILNGGATRCLYLGGWTENLTEEKIQMDLLAFGTIESFKLAQEIKCVFVHFTSIQDAVKAVDFLKTLPDYQHCKIHFGKDRCDRPICTGQKSQNLPPESQSGQNGNQLIVTDQTFQMSDNRAVYIGGLPDNCRAEDICSIIRAGGPLFSIKLLPEKHCAFLTFIDPQHAQNVLRNYVNGLVIKGKRVKLSFGNPSFIPKLFLPYVQSGASRNVYVGNLPTELQSAEILRQDFSIFGEIELINVLPEKNCAFLNYCRLIDAIQAIEMLKLSGKWIQGSFLQESIKQQQQMAQDQLSQLEDETLKEQATLQFLATPKHMILSPIDQQPLSQKYLNCKVSYAKDRVATVYVPKQQLQQQQQQQTEQVPRGVIDLRPNQVE